MPGPHFEAFLSATDVVDWTNPAVLAQAAALSVPGEPERTARACFEFVRDEIRHCMDYRLEPVTWRASDVLRHRTGFCFAKSHLLAALLRANGILAGFCYQRLSLEGNGAPFTLHGYNAVHLDGIGWYRIDARGNKPCVDAQWSPPVERLAFSSDSPGEFEFDNVLPEPLECVVEMLKTSRDLSDAIERLPDMNPADFERLGLVVRR